MNENFTPPPPEPSPVPQPPPLRQAPPAFTQTSYGPPRRSGRGWMVLAILACALFLFSLVFNPFHFLMDMMKGEATLAQHHTVGPRLQEVWLKDNDSRNKIAVIPIEGVIMSQGIGRGGLNLVDVVEEQFKRAAKDSSVKAVILKVNSPGGEVLASDDIYNIIERFQQKSGKPVVAAMGSLAASGGYYVSAPCQWIIANELTITGSIGVIMHGYNFRGLMDKVGVRPEVFKSGKFKDMLSPDKREQDITQEERDMIQSMVNETFDKFKSIVSEGRGSAVKRNAGSADTGRALAENWQQYADGRILSGKEALKLGFIDELGNFDAAVARARKLAKIPDARNLIQYEPQFDLGDIFGMFGQSGEARTTTLKIDVGLDAPRLQMGRLYFLCPLVLPPVKNVTVIDHPLVQHSLTRLRHEHTGPEEFRRCLAEVATLMVYEVTRSFPTKRVRVTTPLATTDGWTLKREVILVPVLRAGLGMLPSILQLIPHARVGFIGLKRHEETLEAAAYHKSLPEDLRGFEILLIDPMLATGGSALAALDLLFERRAEHVRLVNLVAAPEGIRAVRARYAALPIFTAAIDQKLNARGFIVPGLGDAGDRLFGV